MGFNVIKQRILQHFFVLGISINGCNFHLVKAFWAKVQEFGLSKFYNMVDDPHGVKRWVKRIMALAFLPADQIRQAYMYLVSMRPYHEEIHAHPVGWLPVDADKAAIVTGMKPFCQYLWSTWMKDGSRYVHESWSVFGMNDNRTNNKIEGYHMGIQSSFKTNNTPNLWVFGQFLMDEDSMTDIKVAQVLGGKKITSQKPKYRVLNARLAELKARYIVDCAGAPDVDKNIAYVNKVSQCMINF